MERVVLDINLAQIDAEESISPAAGNATTRHKPRKSNYGPNFASLSPIRNKNASPLLKNLTIEEESLNNNDQNSDAISKRYNSSGANQQEIALTDEESESSCDLRDGFPKPKTVTDKSKQL